ncbi:MAG: DUF2971 domain-containing protein [Thermoanaerobaculia bacterium]
MGILGQLETTSPPDQLYHYTSFQGFIGITASRSIWASSIHHLNDAEEFAHGRRLVQNEIQERRRSIRDQSEDDFMSLLWSRIEQIRGAHVFVASFSQDNDLLSQWRGYCPSGKGISVGIGSDILEERGKAQGFRLVPAIYDHEDQQAVVRELIDQAVSSRSTGRIEDDPLSQHFAYQVATISPLLKHATFREEKEWRLVSRITSIDHPQVRVREGQSRIIPYFDFTLAKDGEPLHLRDLKIGPSPLPQLASEGVWAALRVSKTIAQSTTVSSVPYRAW